MKRRRRDGHHRKVDDLVWRYRQEPQLHYKFVIASNGFQVIRFANKPFCFFQLW